MIEGFCQKHIESYDYLVSEVSMKAKKINNLNGGKPIKREVNYSQGHTSTEPKGDSKTYSSKPDKDKNKSKSDKNKKPTKEKKQYKVQLCRNFLKGKCQYGDKCYNLHMTKEQLLQAAKGADNTESDAKSSNKKKPGQDGKRGKRQCFAHFAAGNCTNPDNCRFSHDPKGRRRGTLDAHSRDPQ